MSETWFRDAFFVYDLNRKLPGRPEETTATPIGTSNAHMGIFKRGQTIGAALGGVEWVKKKPPWEKTEEGYVSKKYARKIPEAGLGKAMDWGK